MWTSNKTEVSVGVYIYKTFLSISIKHIYIYIYIYIYKLVTIVESHLKAPFQKLLHQDEGEGATPFCGLVN